MFLKRDGVTFPTQYCMYTVLQTVSHVTCEADISFRVWCTLHLKLLTVCNWTSRVIAVCCIDCMCEYEVTRTVAQWCLRSSPDIPWTLCHASEGLPADLFVCESVCVCVYVCVCEPFMLGWTMLLPILYFVCVYQMSVQVCTGEAVPGSPRNAS